MRTPFKLIICYALAIFAVFLIVNLWGSNRLQGRILEEMKEECVEEADIISEEYIQRFYTSRISLQEMIKEMKQLDDLLDARIWLVNSKKELVADTRPDGFMGNNYLTSLKDEDYEIGLAENVLVENVFDEPMLSVISTVVYDYSVRGYVFLFVPMSRVRTRAVMYMDVVNICLIVISVILLILFLVLNFIMVFPIKRIRRAAMEYAQGNYDYPLKIYTHDEYRELADAMKYMIGEVRNVDDYQKKFIANISHDFRSPLTSIRGYAEAMKDGTIPYEAQEKYLDIILFETDRLTKLTTNLLELNNMDSKKGNILDISSFDINEVIKRTVATFEGICVSKNITVELVFSSKQTYIDADMSKIQQVIYNLLDNAVKFSKRSSNIHIITEEKGSKVLIRIKDEGAGIPQSDIGKIWDRFYKSDASRGKDKKGTGLGLSIVKEIMNAHNENINVISTVGVGTEFTFTLPLSG